MPDQSARKGRPNTMNLDGAALLTLLDQLDSSEGSGHKAREHVRRKFRHQSVLLKLWQSGGAEVSLWVACRNISRGGMSVLHSAYVHPGSRVAIAVPHPKERFIKATGVVVRCTHRTGKLHEIGVKFYEPIDLKQLLEVDEFRDFFSLEAVDPEQLQGTMLHVEESELDQKIVKHYLRESSVRIRSAPTIEDVKPMLEDTIDVVVTNADLSDGSATDLLQTLRQGGCQAPIIAVLSDTSSLARERLQGSGIDAFLAKPLDQAMVLRALGEFLIVRRSSGVMTSTLSEDDPAYGMVHSFVSDLHRFAKRLSSAVEKQDAETARSICMQVAGSAPSLGFDALAKLATSAAEAVAQSMSVSESLVPLRSLISACERAQAI
ncbi:MAG: PilZ domain-containing protein [Planctomycetota bacterium]